jgi:internalin A
MPADIPEFAQAIINKEKRDKSGVLNLGRCGLTAVPDEVAAMYWLQTLILSNEYWDWDYNKVFYRQDGTEDNAVAALPAWLCQLSGLRMLVAGGEQHSRWQLSDITMLRRLHKLRKLILPYNSIADAAALEGLTELEYLDIGSNFVSSIRPLMGCSSLETLDISANGIVQLDDLAGITALRKLYAGDNKLASVEPLCKLAALEVLRINGNPVADISPLATLNKLKSIDIRDSDVKQLRPLQPLLQWLHIYTEWRPGTGIFTAGCPVEDVPESKIALGREAVLLFWEEQRRQGTVQVYEAKLLLVGGGYAGKTSIARKIVLGAQAQMPREEEETDGIEISVYKTEYNNQTMRVNVWDFGGQEILYATHQFFLTSRSLYLLVINDREDNYSLTNSTAEYWLQLIDQLSNNSPVIMVRNVRSATRRIVRQSQESMAAVAGSNNIRAMMQVNAGTFEGMADLIDEVKHQVAKLPHMGIEMPVHWEAIRHHLEILSQTKNYITAHEYFQICAANNIPEQDRAQHLSSFLHDLGVFLHFQDDVRLKDLFILNREWATGAVYALQKDSEIIENSGRFNLQVLRRIWAHDMYAGKFNELLALMVKFELCFAIPETENTYLLPLLLKTEALPPLLKAEEGIAVYYHYESFMPLGIMPFLIVKMHHYLPARADAAMWRHGVHLHKMNGHHSPAAIAEVTENRDKKRIKITVSGTPEEAQKFLYLIIQNFEVIHNRFAKMKVRQMMPCRCAECRNSDAPDVIEYEKLTELRRKTKHIICRNSGTEILIDDLLNGRDVSTQATEAAGQQPCRIFLSYAGKDTELRKKLVNQLLTINDATAIEIYYDEMEKPGADWQARFKEEIERCDIFLMLVSPDFQASPYCRDELELAFACKDRLTIIPIIARNCNWRNSRYGSYNAMPKKGVAIKNLSWPSDDEAILAVTLELQTLILSGKAV